MAKNNQSASGSTFTFRIDPALKSAFMAATETENRPVAQVLRNFMSAYVERKRQKEFAAEARRQSLRIASSRDEKEVMKWMNDVADTES